MRYPTYVYQFIIFLIITKIECWPVFKQEPIKIVCEFGKIFVTWFSLFCIRNGVVVCALLADLLRHAAAAVCAAMCVCWSTFRTHAQKTQCASFSFEVIRGNCCKGSLSDVASSDSYNIYRNLLTNMKFFGLLNFFQ